MEQSTKKEKKMSEIKIAGLVFYIIINFISPNKKIISQIQAYYKKGNIIVRVQGEDYFGDISSENNKIVGERWKEMQDIHNILALGGWKNIQYYKLKSKPPVKVTIMLNQTKEIHGIKHYGIYFLNKYKEPSFTKYREIFYKNEVLNKLKRFCY